ncbi:hypothetical protein K8S19_01265 [bacterium]|nr:hypothetical protein [bacterium]
MEKVSLEEAGVWVKVVAEEEAGVWAKVAAGAEWVAMPRGQVPVENAFVPVAVKYCIISKVFLVMK